jgi:hypothetical protein
MKFIIIVTSIFFYGFPVLSQQINSEDFKILKQKEDSMQLNAIKLIQGITSSERFTADSIFTKMFVRSLKIKNSFYYPYDSLYTISKLYAPDSSFRIYTWQLIINEDIVRQHGAIQMKTGDGSLKLIPLIDKSDNTENIMDTIGNNFGWMGAVYYNIVSNSFENKKIYTLLGYDEYNIRSTRKFIEVMHFENGVPIFGGNFFDFNNEILMPKNLSRYVYEFKKEAGPRLRFDDEMNMIIMEHLISESNEPKKKWTLIGDGDYEGFKWENGKWKYIAKVFNEVTTDGNAPMPSPIRDNKGNINDSKLKGRESDAKQSIKKNHH